MQRMHLKVLKIQTNTHSKQMLTNMRYPAYANVKDQPNQGLYDKKVKKESRFEKAIQDQQDFKNLELSISDYSSDESLWSDDSSGSILKIEESPIVPKNKNNHFMSPSKSKRKKQTEKSSQSGIPIHQQLLISDSSNQSLHLRINKVSKPKSKKSRARGRTGSYSGFASKFSSAGMIDLISTTNEMDCLFII